MTIGLLHLRLGPQYAALEQRGTFTTVIEVHGRTWSDPQPSLLIDRREIVGIGYVKVEPQSVATGQRRLRYTRFEDLDHPIDVDRIWDSVKPELHRHLDRLFHADVVLPEVTGRAVIQAVSEISPEFERLSEEFLRTRRRRKLRLNDSALQAGAQESDAVRLALDIGGFSRQLLQEIRPDGETPYVRALEELRVSEDQAITYDGGKFLDFDRVDRPNGVVNFAKGDERLTIMNVNRRPLEQTTGADLIYVNETLESFVLVQYKTMRREGPPGHLTFRPSSDANLEGELERLRDFEEALGDGSADQWRLHAGCCYMKLCKPVTRIDHPISELVSGMYLPLAYWDALLVSPRTRGPRGGRVLTYERVGRHISNSLFIDLVRNGWIGSRAETSKIISELVLNGLGAGRSVTIASSRRVGDDDGFGEVPGGTELEFH